MSGPATSWPVRPAWVPDDLYPFEDRWLEIDGHRVHFVDEGAGPPLLLLNGNPSWSFGWRDVILGLRGSFRCIAPDYPGFGLSEAAAGFDYTPRSQSQVVERLVDLLGLDGMVVFGYAWGGPIGLGLAGPPPGARPRARPRQHLGVAGRPPSGPPLLGAAWADRSARSWSTG